MDTTDYGQRAIVRQEEETFEERDIKERAARILESSELLIWIAMSRNEVCHSCCSNDHFRFLVSS